MIETPQTTDDNYSGDGVQTPELDNKGRPTRKAFKDGKTAYSVYRSLESDNRLRTSLNAEIVARHTGKPPHLPKDLEDAGQSWRSNFPTLSLMGLEGRVTARLVATIDNLKTLTNSHLSDEHEGHEEKSKYFQEKVTSRIRKWKGWRPFISALWTEDVLIGYATAALLDNDNWRPRLFRSDECFLPQGCAQFPEFVQVAGLKQSFLIHEVVDWIANGKEIAEVAGFWFENVIDSANKAKPKSPLQEQQGAADQSRVYQDLIREGNIGTAYSTGAKGVDVAHVLGIEPDTKRVTHYIVDRNDSNATLFLEEDQFESMDDVLCMFTLEPGNSTYYGSKGVARKTINICTAMDITANDAVDAFRLSALRILKTDAKGGISTQIKVMNPFITVTSDAELETASFGFEAQSFVLLYSKLGDILNAAVGEYLPNQLNADDPTKDKTATADRIDYQREQEQSQAHIARALGQFFDMIGPMQRRLCDPDTTDDEAKELQEELQSFGLTPEEIDELAECPTAEAVQDLATQKDQQLVAAGQLFKGNPNVNQLLLDEKVLASMTSPETARELILPESIDPTLAAENVRQQIIENTAIQGGAPGMPVSPRDMDEEHLKVLIGELQQAEPGLMQKQINDPDLPQLLDNISAALVHGEAHAQQLKAKGGDPTQYLQFIADADKKVQAMGKLMQQHKLASGQNQTNVSSVQGQAQPQDGQQQQAQEVQQAQSEQQSKATADLQKDWTSIYKDAPPDVQRDIERKLGLEPSTVGQPAQSTSGSLQPQTI